MPYFFRSRDSESHNVSAMLSYTPKDEFWAKELFYIFVGYTRPFYVAIHLGKHRKTFGG